MVNASGHVDAVAITESRDAAPANVTSFCRSNSEAPLVLFQGWTSNANESEFNLVVPVLAPPDIWLTGIAALIERSRTKRAAPQLSTKESPSPGGDSIATIESKRHGIERAAKERNRNVDNQQTGTLSFPFDHEGLLGLRTGRFLKSMPEETLLDFQSVASLSSCAQGTVLFVEGQLPQEVFVLLEGQVKLFMNSIEGKRLTVHIAGPGEILGLSAAFTATPHRATAETLYPSKVVSVGCADFLKFLLVHPMAYQSAARELAESCDRIYTRLRTIGVTPSNRAKLARLILEWSAQGKHTDNGIQIHLALKHGEIAECIGTCRETVTRLLQDMQRWHVIEVHGSLLTITDLPALEQCAGLK